MEQKKFVLDTNVILNDANSIFHYPNSEIIIPLCVINKIDNFKSSLNSAGKNARFFLKKIEEFQNIGDLTKGIIIENQTKIIVYYPTNYKELPEYFNLNKSSNQVLSSCLSLKEQQQKFVLVSNDNTLRIKAKVFNIDSQPYDLANVQMKELYNPIEIIKLNQLQWNELELSDAIDFETKGTFENKYYQAIKKGGESILLRFWGKWKKLKIVGKTNIVWNIKARNNEQLAAIDLLLDPKIKIVFLAGKAGTGKTLLAMAAAIEHLLNNSLYHKILISRPFIPMGRDVGYLPGDISDKITPWMQPIMDTLEFITTQEIPKKRLDFNELIEKKLIELEALTYIRGRTISNCFIIIDESQNLTSHEIKTIITRVGENSKIVLTGDPYQIDNPFVDIYSNGISYVMEKMKNLQLSGHVFLIKGERSELSELASNLF